MENTQFDIKRFKGKLSAYKLLYDNMEVSYKTIYCEKFSDNKIDVYSIENKKLFSIGKEQEYTIYGSNKNLNDKVIILIKKDKLASAVKQLDDIVVYNAADNRMNTFKISDDNSILNSGICTLPFILNYNDIYLFKTYEYSDEASIYRSINNELHFITNVKNLDKLWSDIEVEYNVYEEGAGNVDIIKYYKYITHKTKTEYETVLEHNKPNCIVELRKIIELFNKGTWLKYLNNDYYCNAYAIYKDYIDINREIRISDVSTSIGEYIKIITRDGVGLCDKNGKIVLMPNKSAISRLNKEFYLIEHSRTMSTINISLLGPYGIVKYEQSDILYTIPPLNMIALKYFNKTYYINIVTKEIHDTFSGYIHKYYKIYVNSKFNGTFKYIDKISNKLVILNDKYNEVAEEFYKELNSYEWIELSQN